MTACWSDASGTSSGNEILTWYDRSGKKLGTVGEQAEFFDLDLSPDEKATCHHGVEHCHCDHLGS